jgi:hypothetical protein
MTTDLATRRPLRTLTSADLAAFPVWEWAIGEEHQQDASLLRPTTHAAVPLDADAQFVVAAAAALNHGAAVPACVEVRVENGRARAQPLFLFAPNRHLDFSGGETTRVLNQLTGRLNSYPVRWQLAVPLGGAAKLLSRPVKRAFGVRVGQCCLALRLALGGQRSVLPG